MFVLKKKNKRYAFNVLGNGESDNPAVCIFRRFPQKNEMFLSGEMESVFDNVKIDINKIKSDKETAEKEILSEISEKYMAAFMKNMKAQNIDYKKFANECIEGFENFTVVDDGKEIKTVGDLFSLPEEYGPGVEAILDDCYKYAVSREEFTSKN